MQVFSRASFIFKRYDRYVCILLFLLIACLYCYIAYTSFGYDDEYYNIRIVSENCLGDMVRIVQSGDLHPPLSYIINWILFKITHSWNLVRVCSAFLFLSSLLYVIYRTQRPSAKLLALVLLGLNPTILLWGTSLRWYAYTMPILLVLGILPDYRKRFYWSYFFTGFFILLYLGYIGFILIIPYFIFYWIGDRHTFKQKVQRVFFPGLVFAIAYAKQFYVFFTVHRKTELPNNQQVFDLKTSLSSIVSADLSNQGVFPLSVWGLVSIAGAAILFLYLLFTFRQTNKEKHWLTFTLTAFLFVATGIAGKIRNLILLEPSRNLLLSSSLPQKRNNFVRTGLVLLLAANLAGVYNVISHRQTTKNAWNIPLRQTLAKLDSLEVSGATEVYLTHSPTFTYYLTERNKKSISFLNSLYFDSSRIKTSLAKLANDTVGAKNFTFIITYRGQGIPAGHYGKMMHEMNGLHADSVARFYLGRDKEYELKRRFFPDYPEYNVVLVKYYGVRQGMGALSAWEKGM